ncbi:hypothetical protein MED193_18644 [Roseobacter sp. MED193]|nr:hypothetical protein MED193_18644 [Roseobacter sp. MED193]
MDRFFIHPDTVVAKIDQFSSVFVKDNLDIDVVGFGSNRIVNNIGSGGLYIVTSVAQTEYQARGIRFIYQVIHPALPLSSVVPTIWIYQSKNFSPIWYFAENLFSAQPSCDLAYEIF